MTVAHENHADTAHLAAPPAPPPGDAAGGVPGGASSFWLHALAWFLFHLTVVIAWGERNSWPDELLICLLTLPVSILVAWDLYQSQGFGLEIEPEQGQQEQLIAALVLAVGLASGQLLLMSCGLVCLGIGWLRPARPGIDWTEWLKVPLLFVGALPFWLDFEAGRHPFNGLLDNPEYNPSFSLPLALTLSQALLLTYGGLVAMVVFVHGRIFWLALPALPGFVLLVTAVPRWFPGWLQLPTPVRFWGPWVVGGLLLFLLGRLTRRLERAGKRVATGHTLRRWFEERRYPPWLAILVVAVVQALPFQTFQLGSGPILELGGTALLALLLGFLRLRTPKGPIHSRSVAMVAGALTLTLLAEFAASDPIRHLALGFVIIGLLSWHCFWPLRIFVVASAVVVCLFGISPEGITGVPPLLASVISRGTAGLLLLGILAWMISRPLPRAGELGYGEEGWVPAKRFALILLGLMMVFQTASAFWPEHEPVMPADVPSLPGPSLSAPSLSPATPAGVDPDDTESDLFQFQFQRTPVEVAVIRPRRTPYLVVSPERNYERRGWKVLESSRLPHPKGEAGSLRIQRSGREVSIVWWFELGDRAFANPLYARRVLWSSWHLADRHLRLVRLEADGSLDPWQLSEFASEHRWFPEPEPEPAASAPR